MAEARAGLLSRLVGGALSRATDFGFSHGVHPPAHDYVEDMWPKYQGTFIRRPPEAGSGDDAVAAREAQVGRWGLVPWGTKDTVKQFKLSTFNARSETAARSFTFGPAWRRGQHCIIPADAIYEPDWRSGRHMPTRIARADGEPLGLADDGRHLGLTAPRKEACHEIPCSRGGQRTH